MLRALDGMHAQRVVHRDVKLGNVLLNERAEGRLGDFGLAERLPDDAAAAPDDDDDEGGGGGASEDRIIMVTLRLLRMLVRHAGSAELGDVLREGFEATPTEPWRAIVPQLFARIAHPDARVSGQVQRLLARIGEREPQLVVYSAIGVDDSCSVGSKQEARPSKQPAAAAYASARCR